MAYSKLRFIVTFLLCLMVSPYAFSDEAFAYEGKVDAKGNVVFSYVLEGLPLNADEVFKASLDYLQNEYKTTKYEDIQTLNDKGIAYGKGNLNSFYTDNGLVKSQVFSADFFLRIDARDNRARIQLIFRNYDMLEFSDMSDRKKTDVLISAVAPFADAEHNGRYKKAFKALSKNVQPVMNSVIEKLKSVTPAPMLDEW